MKNIVLGAFEIVGPTFLSNAWSHPDSDTRGFTTLAYWQELARALDAGGFDFLFFAEALGYPMTADGAASEVALREGVQFPVLEPLSLITGLAATVDRLGFVVTTSTTAERPFTNARRFSTVDHLTRGRIGWNIVTSDNQEAMVKLLGEKGITPHDERYRRAAEFVDLSLKLWEGSWEDGALVMRKESRELVDLERLHEVQHHGESFDLEGYYPIPPSPQRTPTLFQAGASSRGKDFASTYAECVFIQERDLAKGAALVQELRERAAAHGRAPESIKLVNGLSLVIADTEEEAAVAREALTTAPSREAMGALFMGWSGVDLLSLDPDATLAEIRTEVGQSLLAQYQDPTLTVGGVLDRLRETMGGFKVTGTPESVADQIEEIVRITDVDGFLVEHSVGGVATYRRFIDEVMPLLRSRGLLPDEPRRGTLREMLTGGSARLPADHPGARYTV
ncbi:NtaA/DmoA family FMN-dependent monooxygenase [Herbiconiux moechotypicola]|uniref:LLM class flavin-dependent oxidoreductase n=1 Tax=Herbiconiux moechotypicola TaxID=637393 RepID=A0ABP5R0U7_9MICO|nr:NtaA/DmoA family FMN-dependent monooxygenase [Herbiconiux moechotypicola]MCS5731790.1 NtaA/DmoA family FMN-dependent monooxygenase [Herbiconiux moechotypicola]